MDQISARLWIEAEHLEEDVDDFCNVVIYLSTGSRYALNVWTFDFFEQGVCGGGDARVTASQA